MDRRQFVGAGLQGVAVATCGGLAWYTMLGQQARAAAPLRPPGARAGEAFAASCIRCGQCVKACPYGTLRLARAGGPGPAGTPGFAPREIPCYMCEDVPCVRACPTGALDAGLSDIRQARMGLGVVDRDNCLSWHGLRCEICYRACPVRDKAITLTAIPRGLSRHAMFVPSVRSDACTGCGMCEKKCPTEIAAIRIVDRQLALGRIGSHYRLGGESDAMPDPGSGLEPRSVPGVEPSDAPLPGATAAPVPSDASTRTLPPTRHLPGTPPASPDALDYLNRGATP